MNKNNEAQSNLLGSNIKELRQKKKMSMEEFGKLFSPAASKSIVSRWESGKSVPSNERMEQLATIAGSSINFFSTGKKLFNDVPDNEKTKLVDSYKDWSLFIERSINNVFTSSVSELKNIGINTSDSEPISSMSLIEKDSLATIINFSLAVFNSKDEKLLTSFASLTHTLNSALNPDLEISRAYAENEFNNFYNEFRRYTLNKSKKAKGDSDERKQ